MRPWSFTDDPRWIGGTAVRLDRAAVYKMTPVTGVIAPVVESIYFANPQFIEDMPL